MRIIAAKSKGRAPRLKDPGLATESNEATPYRRKKYDFWDKELRSLGDAPAPSSGICCLLEEISKEEDDKPLGRAHTCVKGIIAILVVESVL